MRNEQTITTNQDRDSSSPSEARQQHVSGSNPFADFELIHSYTRKQAIADGVLVDLMQNEMLDVCRQHYKHPIACTLPVFEIMRKAVENKRYCNDYAGILHDMLYLSRVHYQFHGHTARLFKVIIKGAGRKSLYTFKLVCHPGDNAEPVMTIMLPDED